MTGRAPGPGAFRDGTASTIQFIQVDEDRAMTWTQPGDFEITPANLKQIHDRISPRSGLLVAMADGSVHALPPSIALETFAAIATASGGEIADMSWRFGR
jgi:hypothetical protein